MNPCIAYVIYNPCKWYEIIASLNTHVALMSFTVKTLQNGILKLHVKKKKTGRISSFFFCPWINRMKCRRLTREWVSSSSMMWWLVEQTVVNELEIVGGFFFSFSVSQAVEWLLFPTHCALPYGLLLTAGRVLFLFGGLRWQMLLNMSYGCLNINFWICAGVSATLSPHSLISFPLNSPMRRKKK